MGQTGPGNLGLLYLLTISNIYSRKGCAVIDPQGDYGQNILKRIPPERAADVVYFNPADTDFPMGFNPLEIYDPKLKTHTSSELISKQVTAAESARQILQLLVTVIGRDFLTLVALLIVMFVQDRIVNGFMFGGRLVAARMIGRMGKRGHQVARKEISIGVSLADQLRQAIQGFRVVKAFGAEEQEGEKFAEAAGAFAGAGISAMRVLAVFSPLINLTVNLGIILLLWLSRAQDAGQIGRLGAAPSSTGAGSPSSSGRPWSGSTIDSTGTWMWRSSSLRRPASITR